MTDLDTLLRDRAVLHAELAALGVKIGPKPIVNCPWHDDRKASLSLFPCNETGKWRFRCHACGVSGTAVDARAKRKNIPDAEAVKELLADHGGNGSTPKPTRPASAFPDLDSAAKVLERQTGGTCVRQDIYKDKLGGEVFAVLRLDMPLAADAAPDEKPDKTFRPLHRTTGGWVMGDPPGLLPLFMLDKLAGDAPVVVVEGEKKAALLAQHGFTVTTSAHGAKSAAKTDWSPLAGRDVTIWPDNDGSGRAYAADVTRILSALTPAPRVRVVDAAALGLPEHGDAADLVLGWECDGKDEAAIRAGVQMVLDGAKDTGPATGVAAQLDDAIAGRRFAVPLPWAMLGRATRALIPGTVTILCGSPGATKSLAILQALGEWRQARHAAAVMELEDGQTYHLRRYLAQLSGNANLTVDEWARHHPDEARAAYATHRAALDALAGCIDAPGDGEAPTARYLLTWLKRRLDGGARVVVIDPVSLMAGRAQTPWLADEELLHGAKRLVEEHHASLLLVTHQRRLGGGVKAPVTLDDVAGGSCFVRASQTVIYLRSHELRTGEVEGATGIRDARWNRTAAVLKARNGPGEHETFALWFEPKTLTLTELGKIVRENA